MAQFTYEILPGRVGVITAEGHLADVYRRDPLYSEVLDEAEVSDLKGKALDARLRELGLPTTGTASEKRERLLGTSPEVPTSLEPQAPSQPVVTETVAPDDDRDALGAPLVTAHPKLTAPDRDAEHSKEN